MQQSKPLIGKINRGIPAKSGAVNIYFLQDTNNLKRQWQKRADDFWDATRPSVSNAAPAWREFDMWKAGRDAKA